MAEKPPLSIRLGLVRQERVDAHIARTGLALRAAVLDLIDSGLEVHEPAAAEKPGPDRSPRAAKKVLVAAEKRVGVKPAAIVAAALEPAKLDTSMVQVGRTPPKFGDFAKGKK